jgi:hypothetical protein
MMNTNELQGIYETILSRRRKRGQPPHTFESVKHVVQAMIEGESIAGLSKRMNIYQTLNRQKIAAQEFLDPNNTKRVMSAEDEAWVVEQLQLARQ